MESDIHFLRYDWSIDNCRIWYTIFVSWLINQLLNRLANTSFVWEWEKNRLWLVVQCDCFFKKKKLFPISSGMMLILMYYQMSCLLIGEIYNIKSWGFDYFYFCVFSVSSHLIWSVTDGRCYMLVGALWDEDYIVVDLKILSVITRSLLFFFCGTSRLCSFHYKLDPF